MYLSNLILSIIKKKMYLNNPRLYKQLHLLLSISKSKFIKEKKI